MADERINALTTLAAGDIDVANDVIPIVDVSAPLLTATKKTTPSSLKTALSLNNVNNTSDLNKPISTATQSALDAKISNATHTGDVTGATSLTAQPALITGKPSATIASGDLVLIADINDADALKKVTAQSITDLGDSNHIYTALTSITNGVIVTIDLDSKYIISKTLDITGGTGDATLALSNEINGSTLTLYVSNTSGITRNILLPASTDHIDYSGNSKTISIPDAKSAVFGVTYTGNKFLWTCSIES